MAKKDDEDNKKKGKGTDGGSQSNSRPGSPVVDKDDSRLFQDCYTVHMETASFKVNLKLLQRSPDKATIFLFVGLHHIFRNFKVRQLEKN